MIRLALLRHGHTPWNRAGRIQGRTDIALDPDARAQLADLAPPAPWDTADLYSSPLARAAETAQLVTQRTPIPVPALIEMNWGAWEGQHGADLLANKSSGYKHIEDWGWSFAPPGGESLETLRARLVPWANALTKDSLAVCHIGVMRVLLAQAWGWNFDGPAPFHVKRNRLYIIEIKEENWTPLADPIRLEARVA